MWRAVVCGPRAVAFERGTFKRLEGSPFEPSMMQASLALTTRDRKLRVKIPKIAPLPYEYPPPSIRPIVLFLCSAT